VIAREVVYGCSPAQAPDAERTTDVDLRGARRYDRHLDPDIGCGASK
jgi:hypothetical protein